MVALSLSSVSSVRVPLHPQGDGGEEIDRDQYLKTSCTLQVEQEHVRVRYKVENEEAERERLYETNH